jgi:hypothetical protein
MTWSSGTAGRGGSGLLLGPAPGAARGGEGVTGEGRAQNGLGSGFAGDGARRSAICAVRQGRGEGFPSNRNIGSPDSRIGGIASQESRGERGGSPMPDAGLGAFRHEPDCPPHGNAPRSHPASCVCEPRAWAFLSRTRTRKSRLRPEVAAIRSVAWAAAERLAECRKIDRIPVRPR